MEELSVVTFKWGDKFGAEDVLRLREGVARYLQRPHAFICITDDPRGLESMQTIPLWNDYRDFRDGCYCRLKLFGRDILPTERFLWLDLDTAVVGQLDPLITSLWRENTALVMGIHYLPIINGSFVWHRFGTERWVWDEFSLTVADKFAHITGTYMGTDQSWLHLCLADRAKILGPQHGLLAYGKSAGWSDEGKPDGACLVFFPGKQFSRENVRSDHWLSPYLA